MRADPESYQAVIVPYERCKTHEELVSQSDRAQWVSSAAQSVRAESPGSFSAEHDQDVSSYVNGEIDASVLYRRTIARHRQS